MEHPGAEWTFPGKIIYILMGILFLRKILVRNNGLLQAFPIDFIGLSCKLLHQSMDVRGVTTLW